jgi:hypothetical protein
MPIGMSDYNSIDNKTVTNKEILIMNCFFSSAANVKNQKKPSLLTICYKRWIQLSSL